MLAVAPSDQLRLWEEVVQASPRARVLQISETNLLLHAEQRSHLLRLPDGQSTFAAYSRSEFGYSDMGVNQARLEDWIARVEAAAGS